VYYIKLVSTLVNTTMTEAPPTTAPTVSSYISEKNSQNEEKWFVVEKNKRELPLESQFPPDPNSWYCVGIDEAGRGPVLGPMVYAAAFCTIADKEAVEKVGFMDSKILSESKREELFLKIRTSQHPQVGWLATVISPEELSHKMLNKHRESLNEISQRAAIQLLRTLLSRNFRIKEVYVDTVGPPEKYENRLKKLFPNVAFVVSKRADSLFPIVSAASICAKVIRDSELENWHFIENVDGEKPISTDFGSGYPGDPKTRAWMKTNVDKVFGFPSIVRFSWTPCKRAINKFCVPVQWEGEDDDETSEFGSLKQQRLVFSSRYRFFDVNHMEIVTDF